MRCKTCHYSLSGLTEHRCPECGGAFDPDDPNSYAIFTPEIRKREARSIAKDTIALILFCSLVACVLLLNPRGRRILGEPVTLSALIVIAAINAVAIFIAWRKHRSKRD